MSWKASDKVDRKKGMKDLVKKLHKGATPEQLREDFKEVIKGAPPAEIAHIEEQLVKEGMPVEDLHRFCDIHIAMFKGELDAARPIAEPGHPVRILMEEHALMLKFASDLNAKVCGAKKPSEDVEDIVHHIKASESHYLREENVLFPYLEKHGVTQPPAVMWMEHDQIRAIKKQLYASLDKGDMKGLEMQAKALAEMLSQHFYKENNILFPTGLEVIPEMEWKEIRAQFDEMGYCCFTPEGAMGDAGKATESQKTSEDGQKKQMEEDGMIKFETGELTAEQLEAMLDAMPVDMTFVDADDTVRYFSNSKDRIFARTKAIIGRKVQNCHPQKSYGAVNKILEGFKAGTMDKAEFWINMGPKLVYIRYFAVRKNGKYMGCLEVSQEISGIKKIEGEKRLI
ncbi:MAG: DUF438 domain-containing protein [Euryarchaeota archaeon]|nr:DUF438 domain-containing protein [Euryarchaeota archaeon]